MYQMVLVEMIGFTIILRQFHARSYIHKRFNLNSFWFNLNSFYFNLKSYYFDLMSRNFNLISRCFNLMSSYFNLKSSYFNLISGYFNLRVKMCRRARPGDQDPGDDSRVWVASASALAIWAASGEDGGRSSEYLAINELCDSSVSRILG